MDTEQDRVVDARRLPATVICSFMKMAANGDCSMYYVGITGDIAANKSRHKNDEFAGEDFRYTVIYKCKDYDTAASVEMLMGGFGFDIGDTDTFGCGGNEDSIYVYMFKKPEKQREGAK